MTAAYAIISLNMGKETSAKRGKMLQVLSGHTAGHKSGPVGERRSVDQILKDWKETGKNQSRERRRRVIKNGTILVRTRTSA